MTDIRLFHGNCLDILPTLPDCSVDSIVTDPPYELGFMGKKWDASGIAYNPDLWQECLRVLKPGGHLLSFGGTRTYHRMAVAIEDAGFEIRDSLHWIYGSGFPKSLDVSKAIDKMDAAEEQQARRYRFTAWVRSTGITSKQIDEATGTNMGGHYTTSASQPAIMTREHLEACRHFISDIPEWVERECDIRSVESKNFAEREVIGQREVPIGHSFAGPTYGGDSSNKEVNVTAPATEQAKAWSGWGTALKPAHEPIVVARKPLVGTVAGNVLQWGTGAINIDGTRVSGEQRPTGLKKNGARSQKVSEGWDRPWKNDQRAERVVGDGERMTALGRWPANIVFTHNHDCGDVCTEGCPVRELDQQSGTSKSQTGGSAGPIGYHAGGKGAERGGHADSGGASRFFTVTEWDAPFRYVAKPGKRERNAGLKLCECDKLSRTSETEKSWDKEDQQATHPEGTEQSQKRDTDESGTPPNSDSEWNTLSSGNSTTAQSPKNTKSTTPTTTNLTTESRTFNSSTAQTTNESTPVANCATINGGSPAESADNSNRSTSATGTSAKKAGRSTGDADPAISGSLSKANGSGSSLLCPRCDGVRGGHPTVKPLALMRWLVRLVTPPNGTVLEPFAGSGTTLVACHLEGFNAIGIEMTDEYLPIIEGRLEWARQQPAQPQQLTLEDQ